MPKTASTVRVDNPTAATIKKDYLDKLVRVEHSADEVPSPLEGRVYTVDDRNIVVLRTQGKEMRGLHIPFITSIEEIKRYSKNETA